MASTTVFGAVCRGSNPLKGTIFNSLNVIVMKKLIKWYLRKISKIHSWEPTGMIPIMN